MSFLEYFERATGFPPFPYQIALAERREPPDVLEAPTGAGKTAAAVLAWLWRRRFAEPSVRAKTPRRLVFCLPMRSLVTQTLSAVAGWLEALDLTGHVALYGLLGGAVENDFDGDPSSDLIVVGTQDQLLSRALNRGYAMSRFRWPMHFALLNNDCLWVMDEVQLMGVGLSTSAQLAALRASWSTFGPTHALWMSATMDTRLLKTVDHRGRDLTHHTISRDDQAHPVLARRLDAPKRIASISDLDPTRERDYANALAERVADAHVSGTRTLVVLNRVGRAQAVFAALERAGVGAGLLHSRYRPSDRRAIEETVLSPEWSGVLVSTQTIEAGVDITSKTLFTELAPWSSLVQRFGRCNRQGEWTESDPAKVYVIDLPPPAEGLPDSQRKKADKTRAGLALPYDVASLDHARALVERHDDARPSALDPGRPDELSPTGPVIRRRDVYELFDTTTDLSGRDLDVSRYIRDVGLPDVQIAWREWSEDTGPGAESPALQPDELCRVPLPRAMDFVEKARKADKAACFRWDPLERKWARVTERLVPGVTYLLRRGAGGYDDTIGWTGDKKSKPSLFEVAAIAQDADAADRLTMGSVRFISLAQHSQETRDAAQALERELAYELPWSELVEAAHWHDLGKVHTAFQEMLTSALPAEDPLHDGGPWAKSDGRSGGRRCQRAHFRHELASALAAIEHGRTDLTAYLVACHHGKVRVAIRSRPTENGPGDGRRFAHGVYDGDVLAKVSLGSDVEVPETVLRLDLMELGSRERASWAARALGLLETWGPFRLALMETLVRIADWRASALHAPNRSGPSDA